MIKDDFKAAKRNIQEYYWKSREFKKEIENMCYTHIKDLDMEFYNSLEPIPFKDIKDLKFKKISLKDSWSTVNFECAWFHVTGKLDETTTDDLYFGFEDNGEALLVDEDGSALKGFTTGSVVWGSYDVEVMKKYYPLNKIIKSDGTIDIYIDCASNTYFGDFKDNAYINECGIYRRNDKMWKLYALYCDCVDYAEIKTPFSDEPLVKDFILGVKSVYNDLKYNEEPNLDKDILTLEELLKSKGDNKLSTVAVGHAHLDLAWLWPIRETKRKALRTFSNVLYLIERYPYFKFVVSQPQQLEWVKEIDPKMYLKIKECVKSGNIEIIGGGWVESDTNMPSGESLVRQELYGQKFWKEEFGKYVNVKWLPDTFGYTGSMPQILKKSKQDYFMTIKISWSTFTVFPYQTFNWKGIDGTDVTVHMPPEGTYNSRINPIDLVKAEEGIKETDPKDEFLTVYGIGDGGAGPSEFMLEKAKAISNTEFLPKIKYDSAHEFYKRIDSTTIPTYTGEMYLEKHRGTYTSQSNNKNYNRRIEEELVSYEMLVAALNSNYDKTEIDKIWKEVLLYQFHDILPGSSIKRVYDETDASYALLFEKMEKLVNKLSMSYIPSISKNLYNPTNLNVNRLYKVENGYLRYKGNDVSIKPVLNNDFKMIDSLDEYKNDFYSLKFSSDGSFEYISLNNGEKCLENVNKLRVFKDTGDAWDFEDDYRDQNEMYMTLENETIKKFETFIEITLDYKFKDSTLKETIILDDCSPLISINHIVNWKNVGYMVRSESINNIKSDCCHSDIQFGYLDRSLTNDTIHEEAQFETCCHKWFDVSNDNAGISYINNAKTGFMAKDDIVSVNLLRSTNYPCINAEIKETTYNYGILVHDGGFDSIRTDDYAEDYNKMYLFGSVDALIPESSNENVIVSAFKPAYDNDGYILRLYERSGNESVTTIDLKGYKIISEVDLLEDEIESTEEIERFKPFEIKTFRIRK